MATTDQLIAAYIKLRDQKKDLADLQKQQMKPFNEKMTLIENALLKHMNDTGAEGIRCDTGTASKIERVNMKTEDWDTALEFIKANDLWHMLHKALAKESVNEYIQANGEPPPGIAISTDITVGVRRPTK